MTATTSQTKAQKPAQDKLLTSRERAACTRVAAGSAPHSQRAQALLALDEGATQAEAGRLAGLTRNQVSYWLRQFRQRRLDIFPADQLKPAPDKPAADLPETPAAPEPPGEEEAKAAKKSKKGKPAKKKKSVTAKSKKKEGKKSKKKKTKKKKKGKKKKKRAKWSRSVI